jgi:hypothetical protein
MLVGIVILLTTTSLWINLQSCFFIDNRLLFIYVFILFFYTTVVSRI